MSTADHGGSEVGPRVSAIAGGHAPGVGVASVHTLRVPGQLRGGVGLDALHHVGLDVHLGDVGRLVLGGGVPVHVPGEAC